MNFIQAVFLGTLQGITEFLPISSSGHLLLMRNYLEVEEVGKAFDIFLHFGTLLSVLLFFRKKILAIAKDVLLFLVNFFTRENKENNQNLNLFFQIIIASIPTAILGLSIEKIEEEIISNFLLGICFLFTAVILVFISRFKEGVGLHISNDTHDNVASEVKTSNVIREGRGCSFLLFSSQARRKSKKGAQKNFSSIQERQEKFREPDKTNNFRLPNSLDFKKSLFIGTMQGLAVLPGLSRSGSTIFAGLLAKLSRKEAFEFSFLISIPAILGANALKFDEIFKEGLDFNFLIGFIFAFASGLFSLQLLEKILLQGKFYFFSLYLLALSILSFMI